MQTEAAPQFPEVKVPALWTFVGLAAGLLTGFMARGDADLLAIADPAGSLWLRALQMTIVPLVAALLFTGIVRTVAVAQAGRMALRTLLSFAAILFAGALMSVLLMPVLLDAVPIPAVAVGALGGHALPAGEVPGLAAFLDSLVPANVLSAAASDAMLPLVVFMALFALGSTRLAQPPRELLAGLFEALSGAMMVMIGWVLRLAPLGVFALGFGLGARSGSAAIVTLLHYIVLVSSIGLIVMFCAYLVAVLVARQSPLGFARALLPVQAVAISTQSSLASLPAMLGACRRLGVADTSADFVLPLAVALFRATSPAMNLAVAIYVASLSGVDLTPGVLAAGLGVSMLTTLGAPSLPGTISFVTSIGPIALAMGVPVGPLALLVAVEMLPDIVRTVGNVTMNVAVAASVDRLLPNQSDLP